jgi:hypothetical protein
MAIGVSLINLVFNRMALCTEPVEIILWRCLEPLTNTTENILVTNGVSESGRRLGG